MHTFQPSKQHILRLLKVIAAATRDLSEKQDALYKVVL